MNYVNQDSSVELVAGAGLEPTIRRGGL